MWWWIFSPRHFPGSTRPRHPKRSKSSICSHQMDTISAFSRLPSLRTSPKTRPLQHLYGTSSNVQKRCTTIHFFTFSLLILIDHRPTNLPLSEQNLFDLKSRAALPVNGDIQASHKHYLIRLLPISHCQASRVVNPEVNFRPFPYILKH